MSWLTISRQLVNSWLGIYVISSCSPNYPAILRFTDLSLFCTCTAVLLFSFSRVLLQLVHTTHNNEARPRERSDRGRFLPSGKKSLFLAGRTSVRCQKLKLKSFFCTRDVCLSVWLNIVIGHLRRPYSTHTAPMPVLTGSAHAHILTKPSRAGFAVIRLELTKPGAETCLSSQLMLSYRSACPEI